MSACSLAAFVLQSQPFPADSDKIEASQSQGPGGTGPPPLPLSALQGWLEGLGEGAEAGPAHRQAVVQQPRLTQPRLCLRVSAEEGRLGRCRPVVGKHLRL